MKLQTMEERLFGKFVPYGELRILVDKGNLKEFLKQEGRNEGIEEAAEIIKEKGHQQEDGEIWCNMDETLYALTNLKSK